MTVTLPYDTAAKFADYAHPEMIVSTEWVAGHLDDPGLVVAESDEDVLLYETGHIPGAVKLDRKSTRLNSSHVVTSRMPSSA